MTDRKRVRYAYVRLQLILLIMGAVAMPGIWLSTAQAENRTVGLTLVSPADPDFTNLLDNNFNGISSLPDYQALRPFLAIVRNESPQVFKAYSVAWNIQGESGVSHLVSVQYVFRHLAPANQNKVLRPGSLRLLSPLFNLSPQEYRENHDFIHRYPASTLPPFRSVRIDASVDGEIDSDGTADGPNLTHLHELYKATRNAEHDEAVSLLARLRGPAIPTNPSVLLSADLSEAHRYDEVAKMRYIQGHPTADFYKAARAQSALEFLALFRQKGYARLVEKLNLLANIRPAGHPSEMQKYF